VGAVLLVSVAPALALLAFIYVRDVYEREPRSLVLRTYVQGAALVAAAGLLESVLGESLLGSALAGDVTFQSFVTSGLSEELVKFIGSLILFYRNSQFNEEMDGIVYCSALSLGFATAENILYVSTHGLALGYVRALLPVPAHALFAITMGYYLGKAKFSVEPARTSNLVKALFVPAGLHGAFNYFLASNAVVAFLVLPLMGYLWWAGFRKMREAEDDSPFKAASEAGKGV
jgi:RsiW-degrading membrane proteinase PrsW (M82 family)